MGNVKLNKGTFVRMSTLSTNIGSRMHEVRMRLGYPQSKMAVKLGIADRSYKNYELGKRDLPIPIAVKFCELFDVDLSWLIYGNSKEISDDTLNRVAHTVAAVTQYYMDDPRGFDSEQAGKEGAYIFKQSVQKRSHPQNEAEDYFSTSK